MNYVEPKSVKQQVISYVMLLFGAFLAALSLEKFLLPNRIIDGGIVGISILIDNITNINRYYFVLILNIPFIFLAYKYIAKRFIINMILSLGAFVFFGHFILESSVPIFHPYRGDLLEIVVIGGALLGLGVGILIRFGGCLDGTEILGIILNRKYGLSVGSVVLGANCVIFSAAGFVYGDWQPSIQSLIAFLVVSKVMDMAIVGFDDMKSIMIFSEESEKIGKSLMHDMGLGLTFLHGRGGYTKEDKVIIYLIAERLQLAGIKTLVAEIDPTAFIAIENIHEVASHSGAKTTVANKK